LDATPKSVSQHSYVISGEGFFLRPAHVLRDLGFAPGHD
jgi:hypothetical protein